MFRQTCCTMLLLLMQRSMLYNHVRMREYSRIYITHTPFTPRIKVGECHDLSVV